MLNAYSGPHYGDNDDSGKAPSNVLFSHAALYVPHLVSRDPHALFTTANPELRPMSNIFELAWNHLANEIALRRTLRTVVLDAYFGPGIIKTGLDFGPPVNEDGDSDVGYLHDVGQAFADPVDFDDYIIDSQTKTRESCDFEGNRYRVSRDYAFESELYKPDILEKLMVHSRAMKGPRRAEDMSTTAADAEQMFEYFEFYDLWLPAEGMVLTIPADVEAVVGYLREQEWNGPERGPYEMLGFNWVPNNPLPLPLASIIFDLHQLMSRQSNKAAAQALREKAILAFDRTAEDDAETIKTSADGSVVLVGNVDRGKEYKYGGTSDTVYQSLEYWEHVASRLGGNTDLLGGMQAESSTLGQDQMLMANASVRIDDMRVCVYDFVREVGKKLAWYLWTDPQKMMSLTYESQGVSVPVTFTPEQREGDFLDYNFDIVPYSMSPDSPARKYQQLLEIIETFIIPTLQIGASQGMMLDVAEVNSQFSRLTNLPELKDIYRQMAPQMGMGAMGAPGGSDTTNISLGRGGGARPEPSAAPKEPTNA